MNDLPPDHRPTQEELRRRTEALFDRIIRVGTMTFGEMERPPQMQSLATPPPSEELATPPTLPAPRTMLFKSLPEQLDVETARARLPFVLRLPAWVPDGFGLSQPISVSGGGFGSLETTGEASVDSSKFSFPLSVHVTWRHPDGRGFHLSIVQLPKGRPEFFTGIVPVPRGAVAEVSVHAVPAVLVSRQFLRRRPSGEMEISNDAQLSWEENDLRYSLAAFRWPHAGEFLVRMAESLPP